MLRNRRFVAVLGVLACLAIVGCKGAPPVPDYLYPKAAKSGVPLNGGGYSAQSYATEDKLPVVKEYYKNVGGLQHVEWQVPSRLRAAGFSYEKEPFDIMGKKFERYTFQGDDVTISLGARTDNESKTEIIIVNGVVPD